MPWSMVKETALRDLVRHGVPYDEGLRLLADARDVHVPQTVAEELARRAASSRNEAP